MSKAQITQDPTLRFGRVFSRADHDAYADIHFTTGPVDDAQQMLIYPAHWSELSAAEFAETALCREAPQQTKPVEENTVPSWLWRHTATPGTATEPEDDAAVVFDRVVGSATYRAWREGLFNTEDDAHIFFNECRAALAQKQIIIDPVALRDIGRDWAYGQTSLKSASKGAKPAASIEPYHLSNTMIDGMVGGRRDASTWTLWNRLTKQKHKTCTADVRFDTTAGEWSDAPQHLASATPMLIDLLWHRHMDGSVNAEGLRQATRLLVTLADLLGLDNQGTLAIGFGNLSSLLMALGLPYDSEAGRATAAAIAAIITAEAYAASARLAALRGVSSAFQYQRESVLRALRNHHRAAYDEQNDYEKLSVLPRPLSVASGVDLSLAATARTAWDRAEQLVSAHGLRHIAFTSVSLSSSVVAFAALQAYGVEASPTLLEQGDLHPTALEALTRLSLSTTATREVRAHIAGHRSLAHAPAINHAALRAKGFDADAITRVESALQSATHLRQVFTPVHLGTTFCADQLNLNPAQIDNPAFNLLEHLGFDAVDVMRGNQYCFGYASLKEAPHLTQQQKAVFATTSDLRPEAVI
ncbi:MAG: hypothetical protein JO253_09580, partial [Alphaproteobacteria bacterium]|nr:hypothetical protein [Alphaproteobacteria bacterium]